MNRGVISPRREPRHVGAAAFAALACLAGCSAAGDSSIPDVATGRLALTLPAGSAITSVSYRVLSAERATLVAGTIDLSEADAMLSLDLVLAPASADIVELSAVTSTGASCAGSSAPFDVVAGRPTFVNLTLVCGGDQPISNRCPDIQSWVVTPVHATAPDGVIDVGVSVSDPDPNDTLSYAWIATAGSFADPAAASTVYTCATAGSQTLTLTVSDGQSSPTCSATATFLVSCISGTTPEVLSP